MRASVLKRQQQLRGIQTQATIVGRKPPESASSGLGGTISTILVKIWVLRPGKNLL
jgi:hypothetical protein